MNKNMYVKLETTLSLNDWSLLQALLINNCISFYELEVINKIQEGVSFDIAPDISFDDLPM